MAKRGLVFNIVHGSFVDGYGIRTTVFLKGCPLRCIWCCNPEGQSIKPEVDYRKEKCTGCGICLNACLQKALSVSDGKLQIDRKLCTGCGICTEYCYKDALDMFGKWYTTEELLDIVRRDVSFYQSSGGGVTVGGGEATMQGEFLLEFLRLCRQEHIHTALDTCGQVSDPVGLECLKEADLLLFDIKGLDPERHRQYTGCDNRKIQENLQMLSQMHKPMIVRLPVIPSYTDNDELLVQEAALLASLNSVERVDILPVHEYGRVKYDRLDMPYRLKADPIPAERQEWIRELFASHGLKTQIGG